MPDIDGAVMLRALAHEDALLVFVAVVEATAAGSPQLNENTVSVTWTTVRGVSRRAGLPEATVVTALERLTEAHLIAASPACDGWHTDFSSLREAAASLSS